MLKKKKMKTTLQRQEKEGITAREMATEEQQKQ